MAQPVVSQMMATPHKAAIARCRLEASNSDPRREEARVVGPDVVGIMIEKQ